MKRWVRASFIVLSHFIQCSHSIAHIPLLIGGMLGMVQTVKPHVHGSAEPASFVQILREVVLPVLDFGVLLFQSTD